MKLYFIQSSWLGLFTKTINWALYYSAIPGVILLAINRYIAIVDPMGYPDRWCPRKTSRFISFQWIFGLSWIPFLVVPRFPCHYNMDFGEPTFDDPRVEKFYWLCCVSLECGVFAPTLITLYTRMCITVWKHNKQVNHMYGNGGDEQQSSRTELRLACIGFITTSMYLCLCVFWLCFVLDFTPRFVNLGWYFMSDMFVLSNPYLLLIFCSQVRKSVGKTIRCCLRGVSAT